MLMPAVIVSPTFITTILVYWTEAQNHHHLLPACIAGRLHLSEVSKQLRLKQNMSKYISM